MIIDVNEINTISTNMMENSITINDKKYLLKNGVLVSNWDNVSIKAVKTQFNIKGAHHDSVRCKNTKELLDCKSSTLFIDNNDNVFSVSYYYNDNLEFIPV